jgi:hypothetical protein
MGGELPAAVLRARNPRFLMPLFGQGTHAEAERIDREVLGVKRRVLGEKSSYRLVTKDHNIAEESTHRIIASY